MNEDIRKKTDTELVTLVGSKVIGTPSGLDAQHAQAELLRRNTDALRESKKSADKSSYSTIILTLIIGWIALFQLLFSIIASDKTNLEKTFYAIGLIAFVVLSFYDSFMRKEKTVHGEHC